MNTVPRTFFRAKDAVCPPWTSLTGILLRWMDLTAMGMKVPSGSGPRSSVSLRRIIPRNVVPETTVPTPCQQRDVTLRPTYASALTWTVCRTLQRTFYFYVCVLYLHMPFLFFVSFKR